ncbi:unnamed protein product [Closterium sp. NIES-54]
MLALCREQRLEHRTKHIALRYFLARELQQRGQLRLAYVASEANTADVFTKALAPCDHQRCCTQLAYKLKLSTECVSIQAKLQALSELEAPGGEDLEEFCIIGSETLKELKRLIEDSDGVNRDAKKLHQKICSSKSEQSKLKEDSQHDAKKKTKVVDARKKADAALTLAVAGAVVIPWFVFGATAAGVMAGYGGLMGLLVSKQFIGKAKAELNKKTEDAVKADQSVAAYTNLDFSASPFSQGLDRLGGHLQALEDVLGDLLISVKDNKFHQAFLLRKQLEELTNRPWS